MAKLRILLNGKSSGDQRVRDAVNTLRKEGLQIEVRVTWEAGDVQRLTAEAISDAAGGGLDIIVAAGGDGTINEVFGSALEQVGGYLGSFGVLPLGTANDFSRSAGIPTDDLTAALRLIVGSDTAPMDIGLLDGRPFINVVTGGFGSKITAGTDPDLKKRLGGMAYALTGLARIRDLTPSAGRFRGEGFEWEGEFLTMAVGNGRQAGGGIVLCPEALVNDGQLDLTVLPQLRGDSRQDTLSQILRDGLPSIRNLLVTTKSPWFEYESSEQLHVNLDGEPIVTRGFRVDCRPGALSVRLGSSSLLGY